jgi:LacI family transcriptional regulator
LTAVRPDAALPEHTVIDAGKDLSPVSAPQLSSLGTILRYYKLAREQLAETLGVSVDTVNNWCSGRTTMRLNHFAKILSALAGNGMLPPELQRFVLDMLTENGLSGLAGHRLLPPARVTKIETVLYIAPEVLTKGNRLASVGARDYLREIGISLLLSSADPAVPQHDRSLADFIMANEPRGVMISRLTDAVWAHTVIEGTLNLRIPVIALFERSNLQESVNGFVGIDNEGIGYTAGKYLLEQGHRRAGFIGQIEGANSESARFNGFVRAYSEVGLKISDASVFAVRSPGALGLINDQPDQISAASTAVNQLLDETISGVFCGSEHDTVAFVRALDRVGSLSLFQHQLGVVGITMDDWADFLLGPSFSYIRIPAYEIGREAAKLIMASALKKATREFTVVLPSELRTRINN